MERLKILPETPLKLQMEAENLSSLKEEYAERISHEERD